MAVLTTIMDLAKEGHKSKDRFYELAHRAEDPLPLRYFKGDRCGFLIVSEVEEWLKRNTEIMGAR